MPAETLIDRLLDEISDSGRTPEEVCADWPDLLPEVLRRWRHLCDFEAELDAFFPTEGLDPGDDALASRPAGGGLPQLPGYDVEALLGRGGMGVVYRARHRRLNRPVALKMLLAGAYAGPHERSRFQREAEAVASLRHANIVAIHDVGEHEGCPYFTMELLEGGNLAQTMMGRPQPAIQAASLLITLAEAVQVAHKAGIVHRDLKPANILMTADGTPKIADFGLARAFDGASALTRSGTPLGTPSYMPPEQVIGKAGTIGPAADIYALGAVLYEALTGRPPFRGESAAETERQVVHEEPISPSRLNRKLLADLETICLKCLSKEPQRRYASATALADDLRRFAEGRPIQARPLGHVERSWRWCRRNPSAAGLLAAVLALVGLASGVGVWLLQQRVELRNEINVSVAQAANLRQGYHFLEARRLLDQALQRAIRLRAGDLCRQVDQARADAILAEQLDKARTPNATHAEVAYEPAAVEGPYLSAFADAGLFRVEDDIETVAAAIRSSALRAEIVAALDDWASLTQDLKRRSWILALAREVDPDEARDRLRRPELWLEPARLARVATELRVAEASPQLATSLVRVLRTGGEPAIPLLSAVQRRLPEDFWVNIELGYALGQTRRWDEALGYIRAALALRPDSSLAYAYLGNFLQSMGRADDADEALEHALRLDPRNAWVHNYLGVVMWSRGRTDEAIARYRQAIDIVPRAGEFHSNLGLALRDRGRLDEGIEELRRAVSLTPKSERGHFNLGLALKDKKLLDEAADHLQQAIRIDPKLAMAHTHLASLERNRGRPEQAVDHRRQVVRLDGQASPILLLDLAVERYLAAGACVQAAERNAADGHRDDSEQARRRSLALGWMRENLELTDSLRNSGHIPRWSLASWLTDPAFARVRDPAGLSGLLDVEREPWRLFWADVAAALAADPLEQGRQCAARREWGRAADGYARSLTRGPTDDSHFWYEFAALSLLSGDRPSHTRTCGRMLRLCKAGSLRPYLLARVFTLTPIDVAEASQPGRLAEKELNNASGASWSLTEQAALAYRDGRFQQAAFLSERSLQTDPRPGAAVLNWLWLALAKHRLGETDEARRWLSKARSWLGQYPDGMPAQAEQDLGLHLHNWLEAHVLLLEAEALIQPEARRDGSVHPAGSPPGVGPDRAPEARTPSPGQAHEFRPSDGTIARTDAAAAARCRYDNCSNNPPPPARETNQGSARTAILRQLSREFAPKRSKKTRDLVPIVRRRSRGGVS